MKRVNIITLGCSKNDVDSAQMRALLEGTEYEYTESLTEADAVVVNTCGFIDAAKEESIDAIMTIAQEKTQGRVEHLLLAGCLAQRYPNELMEQIPEVDGIIGVGHIGSIMEALDSIERGERPQATDQMERPYLEKLRRPTVSITEYVKISEGCNNRCTYCIIPKLKGNNRSRSMEDIVSEVKDLVERGAREIILIAQNTTDYGIDLYGEYRLRDLLHHLGEIENLKWLRLMYAYPDHFDDELIEEMATNPKIVPYMDMPLQHTEDGILKRMNRKTSRRDIIQVMEKLREKIPQLVLRTTYLVGFPGETEEEFQALLDFIESHPIERVGSFAYSREEDTPAYDLPHQVDDEIKVARQNRLMEVQRAVSEEALQRFEGTEQEVLLTEMVEEGLYEGRSAYDAPDIDGAVFVRAQGELKLPSFAKVRITGTTEYDMEGDFIEYSK